MLLSITISRIFSLRSPIFGKRVAKLLKLIRSRNLYPYFVKFFINFAWPLRRGVSHTPPSLWHFYWAFAYASRGAHFVIGRIFPPYSIFLYTKSSFVYFFSTGLFQCSKIPNGLVNGLPSRSGSYTVPVAGCGIVAASFRYSSQ